MNENNKDTYDLTISFTIKKEDLAYLVGTLEDIAQCDHIPGTNCDLNDTDNRIAHLLLRAITKKF